jgi:membrane-bound lytic murein transglycosylase A
VTARHGKLAGGLILLLAGLAAVALIAVWLVPRPAKLTLTPIAFEDIAGWADDDHQAALQSLLQSCTSLQNLDPEAPYGVGLAARPGHVWRTACAAAERVDIADNRAARAFFEDRFSAFEMRRGGADKGLLTGYYEPELKGSLDRTPPFLTPLYIRPPDLVTVRLGRFVPELSGRSIQGAVKNGELVPYATRGAIMGGALADRDLELLWVDDPVEAFFLEIQGSGRVRLPSGEVLRVGYAAKNGQPYTSIGRVLIDEGEIRPEDMSMPALKQWLLDNPHKAEDLLKENESFVFFRLLDGEGPLGSQGVPLTPGRSLAIDRSFWPFGMPVWLDGVLPEAVAGPGVALRRLVVAQDTGGAIKGALRGDLFWGPGKTAADLAGHMKEKARFIILLPDAPNGEPEHD